ncbi:E3 ubiquitin-protein ligase TRIM56 [Holothuria leucospilota]|uniref:E3 ubiquitin-protein ligase TRIM56 n=1 Tax=Holothuria leucospilota TaxID=206669 RepID=A0A9Q1H5U8_HOLLE|nr:E3 ubiquitin-protein ligase TRIM56 [Holothuria leucospilota]
MAQQIHQSEDFLHCYICMKRFSEPLMLVCLHSFCLNCLKKYENKVQGKQLSCPVCRRSVELPDEGVEGFPRNYYMINLVDRLEIVEKSKKTSSKCNLCRGNLGVLFCLDCKVHICSKCKDAHIHTKGADNHVIISGEKLADEEYLNKIISKTTPRCDEHRDKLLRFYCKECRQLVCCDCTNGSHQGHECVKAESEAKSAKERLEEVLNDGKEEMQGGLKLSESLKTSVESVEAQATKMLKKVDSQYNKCVEKLKSDRRALRKKIENRKDQKCRSIEKMKRELFDVLQAMKNIDEVTSRVLKGNNPWEMLRMENEIVKSFERIESDLESLCEEDDQGDDASLLYDSDSSSDASDSCEDEEGSSSDSSSSDSDDDGKKGEKDIKNSGANSKNGNGDKNIDPDTHIGIKFRPSKVKPPDESCGEIVARSTSNWRNKNHVGKIVRSEKSNDSPLMDD